MTKEIDELEAAKARIAELYKELEEARTPKQEDKADKRLDEALVRLEKLEAKYQPKKEEETGEEEEDDDQCPECGYTLNDLGDGEYYCPGCKQYFGEED